MRAKIGRSIVVIVGGGKILANIGISSSAYRIETALTRANSHKAENMVRISTGSSSASATVSSTNAVFKNTFLTDIYATQSAIKSIGLLKGFLATAIAAVDNLSARNTRMYELAIMGANGTNTTAETASIDAEAEALIDAMLTTASNANFKGKYIFENGYDINISLGSRGQEKSVYIGTVDIVSIGLHDFTNLIVKPSDGLADPDAMTSVLEDFQEKMNELRVELSSQYAVMEQAQNALTDLTTQYQLGLDIVENVNFSAEVATLAKNQILENAANAMLVQANSSQSGLISLVA